jgi:hypothetical protein
MEARETPALQMLSFSQSAYNANLKSLVMRYVKEIINCVAWCRN